MCSTPSISEYWTGWYDYIPTEGRMPFSAHFTGGAGRLTGTTLEPNTFDPNGPEELAANIGGAIDGLRIGFLKTYDTKEWYAQYPIAYSGIANEDFTRISGTWNIQSRHPSAEDEIVTGPFEMMRLATTTEQKLLQTARR